MDQQSLSSKIKPFILKPADSLTEDQKKSAIDFKEFNRFRKFENELEMNKTLSSKVFFTTMISKPRYFTYDENSKIGYSEIISTKHIGESPFFLAYFKVDKQHDLRNFYFEISITEHKEESRNAPGHKSVLTKDNLSEAKPQNVICFAINRYLLYKKYSFTLSCKYNLFKLRDDNNSSYSTDQTFEKSYALNPNDSIRFESTHNVQRFPNEVICFVEAMFTNMLDYKAHIYDIEIIYNSSLVSSNTPQATFVKFLGLGTSNQQSDNAEQEPSNQQIIRKKSSHKFLIEYRIDPNKLDAPDYGQIRFWWRCPESEVEGGALVFTITDQTIKEKHTVLLERADTKTLFRNQLNDIELYFTNT